MRIFARLDRGNVQSARSRLTDVIKVDRTTATADTAAAAEIAMVKQQVAAAEARIREIEDKDNVFNPLRERMAALISEIAKR
jgi:transcription elongation GreA/GreB family factor